MIAAEVIGLVTLAMRKRWLAVTFSPVAGSATPYALAKTSLPSLAIATDRPGTLLLNRVFWAMGSSALSPLASPPGSGFVAVAVGAAFVAPLHAGSMRSCACALSSAA